MNLTSVHHKEIFNGIIDHVRNNPEMNDIALGGNLNQFLNENEVKRFQNELGFYVTHSIVHNVKICQIDKSYVNGSKPINLFIATQHRWT